MPGTIILMVVVYSNDENKSWTYIGTVLVQDVDKICKCSTSSGKV